MTKLVNVLSNYLTWLLVVFILFWFTMGYTVGMVITEHQYRSIPDCSDKNSTER